MSEKKTLNLIEGNLSKSGKAYIYRDELGTTYISKEKYAEGQGEYFVSTTTGEYQGKPTITNWIAKEEYKPKVKGTYSPSKTDMLGKAMTLSAEYINFKLKPIPKTAEELDKLVLETYEKIKGWLK